MNHRYCRCCATLVPPDQGLCEHCASNPPRRPECQFDVELALETLRTALESGEPSAEGDDLHLLIEEIYRKSSPKQLGILMHLLSGHGDLGDP